VQEPGQNALGSVFPKYPGVEELAWMPEFQLYAYDVLAVRIDPIPAHQADCRSARPRGCADHQRSVLINARFQVYPAAG